MKALCRSISTFALASLAVMACAQQQDHRNHDSSSVRNSNSHSSSKDRGSANSHRSDRAQSKSANHIDSRNWGRDRQPSTFDIHNKSNTRPYADPGGTWKRWDSSDPIRTQPGNGNSNHGAHKSPGGVDSWDGGRRGESGHSNSGNGASWAGGRNGGDPFQKPDRAPDRNGGNTNWTTGHNSGGDPFQRPDRAPDRSGGGHTNHRDADDGWTQGSKDHGRRDDDRRRDRDGDRPFYEKWGEHSNNVAAWHNFHDDRTQHFNQPNWVFLRQFYTPSNLGMTGFSLQIDGLRFGYYQYDRGFRDSSFYFSNYCYAPSTIGAVCSPWYYYCELPPYFCSPGVYVVADYGRRHRRFGEVIYRYAPTTVYVDQQLSGFSPDPYNLDSAIDNIVRGFEHEDYDRLSYLVPRQGDVAIFMDHDYKYSVHANDFYDLLGDAVKNVRTDSYKILDVRTYDDDSVRIEAKHTSLDPWGHRSDLYNTFLLQREPEGYAIREFGTSRYRD